MNRNKHKQILFVLIFIFIASGTIRAQTLPFKHYTFKDGLSSSFTTCIFQGSQGYLWIGSQHGISRFDGTEFHNISITQGLPNDYIWDIIEDKKGNTWFATSGGILCLEPNSFQLKYSAFESFTVEDGIPHKRAYNIKEDSNGNLFIGTPSGICKFDGKQFITLSKKDGLPDNFIRTAAIDKQTNLWVGTPMGLCCLRNNRFYCYTTENGLVNNDVQTLAVDSKSNLLIGTSGGFSTFRKGIFSSYTTKDGLPDNYITALLEDKSGRIWIGTKNGLSYYFAGKFNNISTRQGLLDNSIKAIIQDTEENIWICSPKGISQLVSLHISHFSIQDGLPGTKVYAILQDRQDRFWFGTDNGLSVYSGGTFKNYSTQNGLPGNFVIKLLEDREGKIWIGTDSKGLSKFAGGSFENYSTVDGLPGNIILSLFAARNGTIYIGTNNGLCQMSGEKISLPFPTLKTSVHAILEDKKGNIWYSDKTSLNKVPVREMSHKHESHVTVFQKKDGLPHSFIYSLLEDSRDRIWIGTKFGVSCYYNGKFKNFSAADGLACNTCYALIEDKNGTIWVSTLQGINSINGDSFKVHRSISSLASYETCQGAFFKDRQGMFWFGTANGVTRFDPARITYKSLTHPPVYLTQISVFENPLPITGSFQLEYHRNYIRFGFTGISLTSPEEVTYKYRLKGIDTNWVETRNRMAPYPYLPPGNYTFEVYAKNRAGLESLQPAAVLFKIHPPFWQTWWFRAMSFILLLTLSWRLTLWRIKIAKEKTALEAKNQQLVMAQKMELVGILAASAVHDLKNLLSIIINYSKRAARKTNQSTPDQRTNDIGKIQETAVTAIRVAKQILAFSRRKHLGTRAANLPDLLKGIIDTLKINIPPNIEIRVAKNEKEITMRINPTKFQQLVMNLCLNAVQAMPNGGIINIDLRKNLTHNTMLVISDTGYGIDMESQKNIFTPLFTTKTQGKGTGLGLFVVKQIVDEYKGKIDVQSQSGKGTTFTIAFPEK
ncbi:MAG: GHKL domain-containing protein [bacterium]|nr:GHKL domain-containing protein [bacterium]